MESAVTSPQKINWVKASVTTSLVLSWAASDLIETLYQSTHNKEQLAARTLSCSVQYKSGTLYLLYAVWSEDGDLAQVMTPCKVGTIIRPSTSLARLTFMWWHETQTNSILCIKTTAMHQWTTSGLVCRILLGGSRVSRVRVEFGVRDRF